MRRPITLIPILVLALMAVAGLSSCSDTKDDDWGKSGDESRNVNANDVSDEPSLARLEFPNVTTLYGQPITTRTALRIYTTVPEGINFSVLWDCDKKAQRWSAYQLKKTMKYSQGYYSGDFKDDPDLPFSYQVKDSYSFYRGSGFERGHICPSADRQYSEEANQQTFYYTNMQPQYHMFNSGSVDYDKNRQSPWFRLENKVRSWAKGSDVECLYVVKGGTIEDDQLLKEQPKIKGQLPVPGYFFVALLMKNSQTQPYRAIGFLIPHDNVDHADDPLSSYARNIRQLEQETGFDFFCNLPDDVENHIETLPLENVLRAWKP